MLSARRRRALARPSPFRRALFEQRLGADTAEALSVSLHSYTEILQALGRTSDAEVCARESVETCRNLVEKGRRSECRSWLANNLGWHASVLLNLGDAHKAEQCARESLSITRHLVEQENQAELANGMALSLANHAYILDDGFRSGKFSAAELKALSLDGGTVRGDAGTAVRQAISCRSGEMPATS